MVYLLHIFPLLIYCIQASVTITVFHPAQYVRQDVNPGDRRENSVKRSAGGIRMEFKDA
jgi:hypothetical protein